MCLNPACLNEHQLADLNRVLKLVMDESVKTLGEAFEFVFAQYFWDTNECHYRLLVYGSSTKGDLSLLISAKVLALELEELILNGEFDEKSYIPLAIKSVVSWSERESGTIQCS